jgi:L-fuconolactonase
MTITDAQVHILGVDTPDRPWPKVSHSYAHREIPLSTVELVAQMDAAGVDRAVTAPPSWDGDRNDLAQEAVRLHPGRFAIMGTGLSEWLGWPV